MYFFFFSIFHIKIGVEDNAKEFIAYGGVKVLLNISMHSTREDIRKLAERTLRSNPVFKAEMNAQQF